MSRARLITCVLLPFAAGYYLSYLFRTINALIAGDLAAELGLSAVDLGFLTSVYFLVFAAAQLPFGVLLDRHGPTTIQSVLLLLAGAGALVFALADSLPGLVLGRALIGLGVALALMAGFKAIVLWFPADRLPLVNGWFVMLGALGAVTATAPAEVVVQAVGWRGLFAALGALSAVAAFLILVVVPDCRLPTPPATPSRQPIGLMTIYSDHRFWRLAPLSAIGVGTSWSLQGLWAAPWLKDVDGLDRAGAVQTLTIMAIAVSASGLLLGLAADRLCRIGVKTERVLTAAVGLSIAAQLALVLGWPVPPCIAWSAIAAAGAATVLSYAILAEYFPKHASGRANAALNLLHVGGAFVLQCATGVIIEQWPETLGAYPAEAHKAAMAALVLLQVAALAWFALSHRRRPALATKHAVGHLSIQLRAQPAAASSLSLSALSPWGKHMRLARHQAANWRLAATASVALCVTLAAALASAINHAGFAAHVVEVDRRSTSAPRAVPEMVGALPLAAAATTGLTLVANDLSPLSWNAVLARWTGRGGSDAGPNEGLAGRPPSNFGLPK
ncbi:MAG: MFS transporter [Hyphomonadaceae bacterium]|jgi:MFS family permease|nr:MFS transporter [Hyphomonadaceae bacterium]